MKNILYLIFGCLILLTGSCKVTSLDGRYSREYKICEGGIYFSKKDILILTKDSSFLLINYSLDENTLNVIDSQRVIGKYASNNSFRNVYTLESNVPFCFYKRSAKLFFCNCLAGKKVRYKTPFIQQSEN